MHSVRNIRNTLKYNSEKIKIIRDLWKLMNISNDRFIRTTDDYHVEAIQKIFKKMYEKGDIYKGKYKGKYCTPCESFWTESQLKDGKCPDCGREVHDAEEEAYFFRLSKYAKPVQELLETVANPEPVRPRTASVSFSFTDGWGDSVAILVNFVQRNSELYIIVPVHPLSVPTILFR